ncbi:hypothetical protein DENIS_0500 [Desulfonema ishimotonii]|uniref:Protein kinase n=1 Tax=Desulfonema ishimotonii TaxID=45657 RepID=A0A401FRH2_9BACT|nr:protein kinase [Desulfonema ishimotonii]GBC59561.1 hypothetical protein DENIS_0500 [Desulfonema ishimotonii]
MATGKVFTDTTDFFAIDCGDEIRVGDQRYLVTGYERERRFGIEDPKFWVKKARNLSTGDRKIIKLSYFETFNVTIGGVPVRCFRNPDKEGDILDCVRDRPDFMQGTACRDSEGNNIRILDIVRGPNFFVQIGNLRLDHATYFHDELPGILRRLVTAFSAIAFLHRHGFRHGDIRNDHIIIERNTGRYVWIDFDYDFAASENPFSLDIFGVGNILLYAVGRGFHTVHMIDSDRNVYGDLLERVTPGDFSLLDKWRLMNLQKFYPYIPPMLNNILMHFSKSANVYYDVIDEIIDDLNGYLDSLGK